MTIATAKIFCPACGWRSTRAVSATGQYGLCKHCGTVMQERTGTPRYARGPVMILPPPPLRGPQCVLWGHTDVSYYVACVLVATHSTHSIPEQMQLVGHTRAIVQTQRRQLYRVGLLRKEDRHTQRPIADDEVRRVRALAAEGWSMPAIANATGIPYDRVHHISKRKIGGITVVRRRSYRLTEVGQLMGVAHSIVQRWVRDGWLSPTRPLIDATPDAVPRRSSAAYSFYRDDLADFIRRRDLWMLYDHTRITDTDLRTLAEQVRTATPGRWMKLADVARKHYRTPDAAFDWRHAHGWPGPQWEVVKRVNMWWLWLPNGAALPEPPPDRRYEKERAARRAELARKGVYFSETTVE